MQNKIYYVTLMILLICVNPMTVLAQKDRQFIRQGNSLYRHQNYSKAEIEYRKAISQNNKNPQAYYNLGCALMMQQKDSAAIIQYEAAAKLETSKMRKAKVYHNIGVISQTHQLYGEAIQAYQQSLRNNPNDNQTRYNLALCKRLEKKQQQNKGGKNNQNKNKKDKNKDKNDKEKEKQNKNQQDKKQQSLPENQMSKDNAEQLLNAAIQEEKATQQRLKKAAMQPNKHELQKNW